MRWTLLFVWFGVLLPAQTVIESPVSICGFLGGARGANEVPARMQEWGIASGICALVQDRAAGTFGGELNFWYARTLSTRPETRYATGGILVDVRGRATMQLPIEMLSSAFASAGIGAIFPLNEIILEKPPSPEFEPNTPALAFPIAVGVRAIVTDRLSFELRATYVLTTTDNLNAPHDGQYDGFFALTLGVVVPIGY